MRRHKTRLIYEGKAIEMNPRKAGLVEVVISECSDTWLLPVRDRNGKLDREKSEVYLKFMEQGTEGKYLFKKIITPKRIRDRVFNEYAKNEGNIGGD